MTGSMVLEISIKFMMLIAFFSQPSDSLVVLLPLAASSGSIHLRTEPVETGSTKRGFTLNLIVPAKSRHDLH